MPTLWELKDKYQELWEIANRAEGGEVDPDLDEALRENADEIRLKVDGYGKVLRELEHTAAACKMEAERLKGRQQSAEKAMERIREHLKAGLCEMGLDGLKTHLFTVSVAPNPPSVKITDESTIPFEYYRTPVPAISKSAIAEALKAGKEVPGATLESSGTTLRLR